MLSFSAGFLHDRLGDSNVYQCSVSYINTISLNTRDETPPQGAALFEAPPVLISLEFPRL